MLPPPPPPGLRGVFRTDARARAAYAEGAGIFRIVPAAVCRPASVDDVVTLVRWAAEHRVPLVPRGAGSAMGGGNIGRGVVLDLTGLPAPAPRIDPAHRRARTSASITLGRLGAAAAAHGLRLPPDPSSSRWATVGGVVSTNAAGARSVKYGSVRRWVERVTMVTVEGEVVELGRSSTVPERLRPPLTALDRRLVLSRWPHVRKNSFGYALDHYVASGDVLDLVVGSEGTLGIVTEVEWRLDATPAHTSALRVTLESLDHVATLVAALAPFAPSALELLDRTFLDLVHETLDAETRALVAGAGAIVLVELEGEEPAALAEHSRRAADAAAPVALGGAAGVETALAPAAIERLWRLRHAASPLLAGLPETRRSLQVIEDACVPVARIGDYIRAVRAAAERHALTVVCFGHAGDGNVHVNLLPELARPDWQDAVAALLEEVTAAVVALGGVPSGEHGVGRLRASFLEAVYGVEVVALMRRVKAAFDPLGILNPGVILPDGSPPIQQLKAGHAAAPLPADIAAGLRAIERGGGYARARLELADEAQAAPLS
ncbi:MAG TPA: FAD-binding oxidoreductase [Gemmatimonadales bacterium]|nr:FAD-binding oxidoreductase [Gemmatimonadales bacterium]